LRKGGAEWNLTPHVGIADVAAEQASVVVVWAVTTAVLAVTIASWMNFMMDVVWFID